MRLHLKIHSDEAGLFLQWFSWVTSEGADENKDHLLVQRLKDFINQDKEYQKDGERATENNQRKQTD